jgi:hypothetical protein
MKRIIVSSMVLLFGIVGILGGISKLNNSTVDCGGKVMGAGDTCVTTAVTGVETGSSSFEEQEKSSNFGNWVVIGVGAIIVLIGAENLKIGIKNRRKKPGENTPGGLAPAVAGLGEQQGVPWNQPAADWQQAQPQQPSPQYPQQGPPPQGYQQAQPGWDAPPSGRQPGWGPRA